MILYRVCKKDEVDTILEENDFSNVGCYCSNVLINTHDYKYGKKYMHFFDVIRNIFYLNLRKNYYICVYDVPCSLLRDFSGIGYYTDVISFSSLDSVKEYAVIASELSFEYLKEIYKIKEYLDIDDYLYNDFTNNLELVYRNGEKSYEKILH